MNKNIIKRGSTAQETITLPDGMLDSEIEKIIVPYSQGDKVVIQKETGEITVDANSLVFEITEQETLQLRPGKTQFEVDIKYASGAVARSYTYSVPVMDTLLDKEV